MRTLTSRCWMAENFPMSLRQLLPVLDVVGNANKHMARVGKFLQKYGNMDLFPVKVQARSCKLPVPSCAIAGSVQTFVCNPYPQPGA